MGGANISFRNIVKFFEADQRPVLNSVNLEIKASEVICIVGPSGCGKTTLLNVLAGFEQISHGACDVDGRAVAGAGPDRGFVFQKPTLYPWMTMWQNVTLGARVAGRRERQYRAGAENLLQQTGLTDYVRHFPYQISGGMAQRAQLVRVLLSEPKVMLMDEPFGALDYQTRLSMHRLLMELHGKHKPTIVFITHDVDEAVFLADRVIVMSQRPGTVIADLKIDLPRPRALHEVATPQFGAYKEEILSLLGFH
ncbi:ABC transporter ATP-binding protein [Paraburkholderia agricolaris]|uniref:ABC transporter ATP-binding protein n=1 Tax=Paraburkholderia agricolaris TaxID=2152888 RepID=UPI0012918824|nr:ABC transporter ATP-binding protein [Paraburkholderia agricolaris]